MAKSVTYRPTSMKVCDENRSKRKAWVRDSAIKLMATFRSDKPLSEKASRDGLAFVAVETAAAVWDWTEQRYSSAPQNETEGNQ